MKILLIKTSSLGDVIHTLPAVAEAKANFPQIEFDWVVEEAFAEVPHWQKAVAKVIPIALRRWRKNPAQAWRNGELQRFWQTLRSNRYDFIIDAQGLLLKSALIAFFAIGKRCGFDWRSAREPLAALFYQRKFFVDKNQHAALRTRQLFAEVLGGKILPREFFPNNLPFSREAQSLRRKSSLIFIHSASRQDKCWPEENWRKLALLATEAGFTVQLPWGNEREKARALRIAKNISRVEVLSKLNLSQLAQTFAQAKAAVAIDTGLGHLAAIVQLPTISLYGPTDPNLIGTLGPKQVHIRSEKTSSCVDIDVATVWQQLEKISI